jgi:hypothetical protein
MTKCNVLSVVPAKAGTHNHRHSRIGRQVVMGPGSRLLRSLGRDDDRGMQ